MHGHDVTETVELIPAEVIVREDMGAARRTVRALASSGPKISWRCARALHPHSMSLGCRKALIESVGAPRLFRASRGRRADRRDRRRADRHPQNRARRRAARRALRRRGRVHQPRGVRAAPSRRAGDRNDHPSRRGHDPYDDPTRRDVSLPPESDIAEIVGKLVLPSTWWSPATRQDQAGVSRSCGSVSPCRTIRRMWQRITTALRARSLGDRGAS